MRRRLSWLALALLMLGSCTESELIPRTQVLVQIEASDTVKARARTLRVSLASREGQVGEFEPAGQERFTLDKDFTWPASLALLPKGGDATRGFRIFVEALDDERAFVTSRVISYFLDEQTLLLEIVLEDGCVEYLECNDEETCVANGGFPRCASAKQDPNGLKAISKAPTRSKLDAATAREDAGQDADLPDASEVDADLPDASEVDAAPQATPEDCFNGSDDDLDSLPDCADPDCNAGAVCVADAPELAVKVPSGMPCPAGYARQPTVLHKDLSAGACTGCACGAAGATSCSTTITGYSGPTDCSSTTPSTDGPPTLLNSYTCSGNPIFWGSFNALGVSAMTVTPGTCPASGTASRGATSWASDITLCYLERKGGGCPTGSTCAARPAARPLCVASPTATSCATGETREIWYSGVNDTRSCGACSCIASGASCSGVSVNFGNDYSCGTRNIAAGQIQCGYAYAPPANLIGTPTRATCSPTAPVSGAATATGPTNLCCRP